MQTVKIAAFKIIGLSVRTSNANGQSAQDIGALWGKFMSEGISSKIPNKIEDTVFSIYTNYEGDHTMPYDTVLGCKVDSLDEIPEGMIGQSFEGGEHVKFVAKGNLAQGAVYQTWGTIWGSELDRKYTADFEVYGEKAQNPADAEVDIFVAVN